MIKYRLTAFMEFDSEEEAKEAQLNIQSNYRHVPVVIASVSQVKEDISYKKIERIVGYIKSNDRPVEKDQILKKYRIRVRLIPDLESALEAHGIIINREFGIYEWRSDPPDDATLRVQARVFP